MKRSITGLHHVTAIATDAQANIDFYSGLLGLRLVKQTAGIEDPSASHLYYGDEIASPGSIVTFFSRPRGGRGRSGAGQPSTLSLAAPARSLGYWEERLFRHDVAVVRGRRFDEDVLTMTDPDGISVEIVEVRDDRPSESVNAEVSEPAALRGLHTAALTVPDAIPTAMLLSTMLDHAFVRREGNRTRFQVPPGGSGRFVDVIADARAPRGMGGAGTIHHIALRVGDDAALVAVQQRLIRAGYPVSQVRVRQHFRSLYYRDRNGILFEMATDVPGFGVDHRIPRGSALDTPERFEADHAAVETVRPPHHEALQPA